VVRRFVRGDPGLISELATRLAGSSDLYQAGGRLPVNSINFVTSHDGFTLYDQVSYNEKHNYGNGEDNRDGHHDNLSWNCGHEGDTADAAILELRQRQAKNFAAILLLSHGVPMLLAGDEVLRSQKGNNNAWCQDNEISWFDWTLTGANADMLRFVREMIAFRKRHGCLRRRRFLTGNPPAEGELPDVAWHGYELYQPRWADPEACLLAYTLSATAPGSPHLHVVLNMSEQAQELTLPVLEARVWHRAIDTSERAPGDIVPAHEQQPVAGPGYRVSPRSVLVFEGRQMPAMP
jgi:glycogen operon protein